MKQLFISLFIIFASASATAQTPGDLFAQYKGKKNAEYVHMGRVLFKLLRPLVNHNDDDPTARTIMRSIRSMRALNLEDCSQKVKEQFLESAKRLSTKGYEQIVSSNVDGERTLVLVKLKKNAIRELLVLNADDEDCQLLQLKGKMKQVDLGDIIKNVK